MVLRPLWNIADAVAVLGGPTAVGRLTDRSCSEVSAWRRAGSFPPKYYVVLKLALERKGYYASLDVMGQAWCGAARRRER
jgi:hypothetical protein